jgi:ribose transport system ATP-binding protein
MTEPPRAAHAAPTVLEMKGITKRYPGVVALDGVSVSVRAGEVHVLLGENGAGKSTLVKILSGAVRRDGGEILLDGDPAHIRDPQHARRRGISVIHQELALVPRLSVAENVFLGKAPTRPAGVIDWTRMRRDAAQLLTGLGVALDVDAPVGDLGIAQQQMVEVARALADDARILVMDEPTSALSEREVEQLFAAIARLTARGVAVIYISHRMAEVFRIGRRVTVLRDGRDVATRDLEGATVDELVRLMAGRTLAEHYPRHRATRGDELLRVEGLGRTGVLHDITFALRRGEILGIAGLVGAGRTELARALIGADPVSSGRIAVRGETALIRSPRDAVRYRIGFLPEDRKAQGLVLGLSVDRNVSLSHLSSLSRFGIMRRRRERDEAVRAIDDLRIRTPGPDQRVVALSGGNQQKVVLAKWLAARADVFVFDEPTRGIDVAARYDIYLLMNRLVESGAGVIMISSDLPEVVGMSDRILVMRGGAVRAELSSAEASDERVLEAALGVAS